MRTQLQEELPALQSRSYDDMTEIVKRLDSKDSLEREQAAEQLCQVLAQDLDRIKRNRQFQWGLSIAYLIGVIPLQFHYLVTGNTFDFCLTWVGYCICVSIKFFVAVFQRRAARRIAALDTPHVVGPLIDALATSGLFWNKEIRQALIRLLPRLQASDAALLNSRQHKYLSRFLIVDEWWPYYGCLYGAELKIAILKALEQIGDKTATRAVRRLTHSRNSQVRLAAIECLPFLQERAG